MLAILTAAAAASLAFAPSLVNAQLDSLRGTIPGSLHQCENTNMFFFDSSNSRPLTVLFLDPDNIPDSARTGTIELSDAAGYSPLQVIQDIETPDAAQYNFVLGLEAGQEFEVFAFLENGQGKALSLTRTVTTPLPGATSCLGDVQTTVSGVDAVSVSSSRATSSSSSHSTRRRPTSSTASPSNRVSGVDAAAASTTASSSTSSSSTARRTTSASASSTTGASTRSTSTTRVTATASPTPAGNAAGNADAASLSSIPTGSAPSNMLINGMLVLVASLAGLAML